MIVEGGHICPCEPFLSLTDKGFQMECKWKAIPNDPLENPVSFYSDSAAKHWLKNLQDHSDWEERKKVLEALNAEE